MNNKSSLSHLREKEKLLYLEVEQLRMKLYLHDSSLVFEFLLAFHYTLRDIKNFFIHNKKPPTSITVIKNKSIQSLLHKKNALIFLSKTPYAWMVYSLRHMSRAISFQAIAINNTDGKSKQILIFGATDAANLQSRSVQIARKMAEKSKILYIEGVFDEGNKPWMRATEESQNFTAIRLTALKSFHLNYQNPSPKELSFLKRSIQLSALNFTLSTYILHPFWRHLLPLKKNTFSFDHAEDFIHLQHAAKHIQGAERKLLKDAHIVTAPHKKLLRNPRDIVIVNGVEWDMFKDTSKMIQTCDVGLCWIKKPVLGFIGTLDERIDEQLVGRLAAAFPSASVVLVGNTDYRPIIEVAEQHPNIFPVGKQPYKKLPLFLQSFDILIAPYKYTKTGTLIFPELPLYFASGKPIVATATLTYEVRYRPLQRANKCLYLPKSHTDWIIAVSDALKEDKQSKNKSLRVAAAKKLKWKVPKMLY